MWRTLAESLHIVDRWKAERLIIQECKKGRRVKTLLPFLYYEKLAFLIQYLIKLR